MPDTSQPFQPDRIQRFAFGFAPPLIIEAAVEHGVFDQLAGGEKTADEMAKATGTSLRGMRSLLDALVGLELVERPTDAYRLTAESEKYLVSDSPEYQGGMFRHISGRLLPNWLQLKDVVRTGQPAKKANRQEQGAEFFSQFVADLFPRAYPAARRLADAWRIDQLSTETHVLDLAAGSAVWSIALAERSPHIRATVVDWPEVTPVARRIAGERGVVDRYRFVEGDLLEADFGQGYRYALLGHILHSEGEGRSRQLLAKTHAALEPGGTIMIAEMLPDDDRRGPAHALLFSVNMLVHTEVGDTYTFAEIGDWLADAGFCNPRLLDVPAPSPLILADKGGSNHTRQL
jgi:hypothetical protein